MAETAFKSPWEPFEHGFPKWASTGVAQEDAPGSRETVPSTFPNPGPCYLFALLLSLPGAGSQKFTFPVFLAARVAL